MLERGQQQRLSFEIGDRFFVLRFVDVRLDHFLDGAGCFAQVAILGQIHRAHAPTTDAANDLVAAVQDFSRGERLGLWLSFFPPACARGCRRNWLALDYLARAVPRFNFS